VRIERTDNITNQNKTSTLIVTAWFRGNASGHWHFADDFDFNNMYTIEFFFCC